MNIVGDLTDKIVAFPEVPDFNTDDCIDWAIEMISLGYENPSVLILSALTRPTNYFETIEYLQAALKELKLTPKTGIDGIRSYGRYILKSIANGINVKENLSSVYKYCQSKNYEKDIYDFYLLYWAWGDLDYRMTHQEYWPEADANNIENIVIKRAKKWLIETENM